MKLDVNILKYLTKHDFRVLASVEMGMKNHQIVPYPLIETISGLPKGLCFQCLVTLHKNKLVVHDAKKYDGYFLTCLGYDYLAIHALINREAISAIGRRIGVGKESDIYECVDIQGVYKVLKIHRLGRISFHHIKEKRSYLDHRHHASYLYLSRLAAYREYNFMKSLSSHNFPVPIPYDYNRHIIVMSYIPGKILNQVDHLINIETVFDQIINLILKLTNLNLIHCDLNEFNLIYSNSQDIKNDNKDQEFQIEQETITLIDFPQMISTHHQNASFYFDRDINGIANFFSKKFQYNVESLPSLSLINEYDLYDEVIKGEENDEKQQLNDFFNKMNLKQNEEEEKTIEEIEKESEEEDQDVESITSSSSSSINNSLTPSSLIISPKDIQHKVRKQIKKSFQKQKKNSKVQKLRKKRKQQGRQLLKDEL